MPLRAQDLTARIDLLERQWTTLHDWVATAVTARNRESVSILDGWTVAELVAHLGRAMDALAVCQPAPRGTVPSTLAEYLGGYAGRAADIAAVTQKLAEQIADDPLRQVEARARAALNRARELGPEDRVVQARRAPVLLSTMLASRITELVVHADDLQRSLARSRGAAPGTRAELGDGIGPLPGVPGGLTPLGELGDGVKTGGPIDGNALDLVATELLRIVVARGGWDLEVIQPLTWVRLAAGRLPYDVDVLTAALAPRFTSDAVPDLGRMLPVL